jgi:PAB1-binding protein PBP1
MQQSISQKIMTQRYYSLLLNSVGEMLTINFISGDIIEGLLDSIDPFNNEYFIINNPRRLSRTGVPIFLKESKLKIYFKDISHINYDIKKFIPQIKNNFETDLQISKKSQKREKGEKKLVKYEINENNKNKFAFQSLEDDFGKDEEKLDQFEINKKRYNIVSTYDENLYTTKLDKNKITEEDKKYADKMYKEIMSSSNNENDIHILEDRGIIQENDDFDEEDKYSSVIKNNNK